MSLVALLLAACDSGTAATTSVASTAVVPTTNQASSKTTLGSTAAGVDVDGAAANIAALLAADGLPIDTPTDDHTPRRFDSCPFGDRQTLGVGRLAPDGYAAIDTFTHWRADLVDINDVVAGLVACYANPSDDHLHFQLIGGPWPACDSSVPTQLARCDRHRRRRRWDDVRASESRLCRSRLVLR